MSVIFAFRSPDAGLAAVPSKPGVFMPGRNGKAVILIHGLTGTPAEVRFLAWFLNTHGYTVSCPRLANHGQPMHILKATRWEEFYASARQAYEELRADHQEIFVAGLSLGALLALLLADEFQTGVAGVSCLSPTLFYDGWNVPWYYFLLPLASRTPLKNFTYFKEEPPYGLKSAQIRAKVHEFYEHADIHTMHDVDRFGYPFFPVRLLAELHRLVAYLEPRLPRVQSPCQIIQARNDDVSSVKNAQRIHDRVGSARKEIVYLEDSYHVITADQERAKVAQSILDFFAVEVPHA
jgi:carboxylesterase